MGAQPKVVDATARHLASDERGVGLRATWRPNLGFVNLSLWRNQRCVETFHLTPVEAAKLVGFLVNSLASVAPEPRPVSGLRPVEAERSGVAHQRRMRRLSERLRGEAADRLEQVVDRLRP